MVHPDGQSLRGREDVYQWYTKEIANIPPAMQEVFERYSGIPPGQVIPHVAEVRDQAFHLFPYPCIGQLRFLNLNLSTHPLYPTILSRLKTQHQTLLDAGCCFGQELRKLAYDGAPPSSLYGMDLEQVFLDLGHTLFLDRAKMRPATFVAGSLLPSSSSASSDSSDSSDNDDDMTAALTSKIDIIHASSLLHLFTWDEQILVVSKLVSFLKPRSGSMMLGRNVGAVQAGEYRGLNEGTTTFRHNVESFEKLWREVGRRTGSTWRVEARLDMVDVVEGLNLGQKWMQGGKRLHFVVVRE